MQNSSGPVTSKPISNHNGAAENIQSFPNEGINSDDFTHFRNPRRSTRGNSGALPIRFGYVTVCLVKKCRLSESSGSHCIPIYYKQVVESP